MEFIQFIDSNIININMDCTTKEEFFKEIHNKVFSLGYVTENFGEKVLEREKVFPTAVNLEEYGACIPHTDAEYIKEQFIAVCTFKDEVIFNSMEDENEEVKVKLAFVLGLNQPHNQLKVLTELMGIMQNKELIEKIVKSENKEEVLTLIKSL